MSKILANLFLGLFIFNAFSQTPTFDWVARIDGNPSATGTDIVTDVSGNIFITGHFTGTVDFDPGPGTVNLTSTGLDDIFVQKLDPQGNLLWVKQMGAKSIDMGKNITVDAYGNVYTIGFFMHTVDFDPGASTYDLSSVGGSKDIFVQKLDPNGNFIWAKKMGGASSDIGQSIAVDLIGNVIAVGIFEGTSDFDPGNGNSTLTTFGGIDIFILKLDINGDFLWVNQLGGKDFEIVNHVTTDSIGNILSTGYFNGIADFDPGLGTMILTPVGKDDVFVLKLDVNGGLMWVNQIGGKESVQSSSIVVDIKGNVYTTGSFKGEVDFDSGSDSLIKISKGSWDVYTQKLDYNGNFLWVATMGGPFNDGGRSLSSDAEGNIYTLGVFSDTADLNPGMDSLILFSNGRLDVFIQKLDPKGEFGWVLQIGGLNNEYGNGLSIDTSGNVISIGIFSGTVDFDPGIGIHLITTLSSSSLYIQKLEKKPVGLKENKPLEYNNIYPNPSSGRVNIVLNQLVDVSINIFDTKGDLIFHETQINDNSYSINLKQPPGLYFIEIISNDKFLIQKLIVE
jgi:Secretion system C-terminal sorting domain/Beta-propeller repeat